MYRDYNYLNTDNEFQKVKDFLRGLEAYKNHDNNWDPSRFDWWRYSYHYNKDQHFFEKSTHYWTHDDEVVALAISEYGEKDIFILVHPDHHDLYDSVIDWVIDVFGKGKEEIISPVFLIDPYKVAKLEERGFVKGRHENNVRTYDLTSYDFEYELDASFRLLNFSDYLDYKSKSRLICSAFSKKEHPVSRIESFMKTPGYMADLDLICINQDNEAVAYCTGWLEQHNEKLGYIEPMGVHEAYRRRGLGKALAKACFKRLRDKGVDFATIASNAEPDVSNYLYDSLKPIGKKSGYEFVLKLT
ncbi:GNAT family N-acetyltransferase [Acidaminobacter sp. JC074]|uniref:GNAT family N-acetyltransferase n=1 Tax=Acidaminobacter sp. JC074 TaxID=2530199 RepID=UPI001F10A052|nr:GNAT family N-acetyltransferase [Acidaminobacter sp. JC074]MCH4886622.1 GNAT family N-acetyltransferase [Acidaminobacter sp. JC074]